MILPEPNSVDRLTSLNSASAYMKNPWKDWKLETCVVSRRQSPKPTNTIFTSRNLSIKVKCCCKTWNVAVTRYCGLQKTRNASATDNYVFIIEVNTVSVYLYRRTTGVSGVTLTDNADTSQRYVGCQLFDK